MIKKTLPLLGILLLILVVAFCDNTQKKATYGGQETTNAPAETAKSDFVKELREHQMKNEAFPLRSAYSNVEPIAVKELNEQFDQTIMVDSRSKLEYDVIHIQGASNILVGYMEESDLLKLRNKDGDKKLVFYCNGTTCSKSYKAAQKSMEWGFKNVRVFDAGIFEWARAIPQKTLFFNVPLTPQSVEASLIPEEEFNKISLPTEQFIEKALSKKYMVVDIRDANEKNENPMTIERKEMDLNVIQRVIQIEKGPIPKSSVLFLDNVGKQVDWLHYYLKKYGYSDYYFLKGGVLQWQKDGFDPSGAKKK